MHPTIGEINLHTVDIRDFFSLEFLFYGFKNSVDINFRRKLDLIFAIA